MQPTGRDGARRRVVYDIPDGCPYTQPMWFVAPKIRAPLIFLTLGEVSVAGTELCFSPDPRNPFGILGGRWSNLLPDFSIAIPWKRVIAVEPHRFRSPVAAQWDVTFARVRTAELGLAGDFLLAPGPKFFGLRSLTQRREQFAEELQQSVQGKGWHAAAQAAGA